MESVFDDPLQSLGITDRAEPIDLKPHKNHGVSYSSAFPYTVIYIAVLFPGDYNRKRFLRISVHD